jgi:ligand-binding sensor domain-containing protein/signal transduction histidine kinase
VRASRNPGARNGPEAASALTTAGPEHDHPHVLDGRRCGLAVLVLASAASASALDPGRAVTQYSARTWYLGADLPQAAIQAIAQTPDGYLWLGTRQGLVRFDGVRSTVFDRSSGLPDDNVWALRVDRSGRLWVGTDGGGLALWEQGLVRTFSVGSGLGAAQVRPVLERKDGALWVGTRGGGVDVYQGGRWAHLTTRNGLASGNVWALAEAVDGGVWVGADGVNHCAKDACRVVRTQADGLPHNRVVALTVARNGDLWVGTWAGLSRLRDGRWMDWTTSEGLPGAIVRVIHEDRDGNIWIGTSEGLTRFRDGTFSTMTREQGAAGGYVRAIFEDGDGTLWVGSAGSGLTALSDGQVLNIGAPEGLARGFAFSVLEAADGGVWVGTSHGLSRLHGGAVSTLTTRDGLPSDVIGPIAVDPADPDRLWIGTQTRGLVLWKPGAGIVRRFDAKNGLPSNTVSCLYPDRRGGLWVGTEGGLVEMRGGSTRVYTSAHGLPGSNVRAVIERRDGTIWAGTYDGLAWLDHGRWSADAAGASLPRLIVNALHEDDDGVLWAATSNDGLGRLDGARWTTFDIARGFCSDVAYEVLEDDQGHLWTNSSQGLCRASRKALNALARGEASAVPWRVYDRGDGIRDTGGGAGTNPGAWKARDGRLLFATHAGIVVVDPARLREGARPRPVAIEALVADGVAVPVGGTIALGPGRPRLEFRFTSLALLEADRTRFQYWLDGFDPGWIDAGSQRLAHYTNVPAGRYTFRVRAKGSDGAWNESAGPLALVVRPRFWETAWFAAPCAVALLGLIGAAHRIRVRRVRARLDAVVAERTRVARELHDTLAQGIAGAKLQVESALETIADRPEAARRFLELGQALLASSLAEVRRSIWILRAQAEKTPEGLGPMLTRSLQQLTSESGIGARLTLSGSEPTLSSDVEHHVLRIAHEAVTNAVRHARPRTLEVDVRFEDQALELRVRDDGTGFDPGRYLEARDGNHFGLVGLHERTQALGGALAIRSAPGGGGTEVTCRVPYDTRALTRKEAST